MNKNHVVFHGSVNSAFLSAAAHAGGGVHEAGLQLVAQTQAHGRTQRDTVDGNAKFTQQKTSRTMRLQAIVRLDTYFFGVISLFSLGFLIFGVSVS